MKTRPHFLHQLLSFVLALFLAGPAAANYSQIIAFGDSLSDIGNLYRLTSFLPTGGIPGDPYFAGRFSNGLLAVESMGLELRLNVTSYAFAGAQTGTGNQAGTLLNGTGLTAQVNNYARRLDGEATDANALYFVWAGPNDFYSGQNMYAPDTAITSSDNVLGVLTKLFNLGARYFFVPLMPDLSVTPAALASSANYRAAAKLRTQEYNQLLREGINELASESSGMTAFVFDTPQFIASSIPALQQSGYNLTDACFNAVTNTVCNNQSTYLFWDGVHPTAATGRMLGVAFAATASVPEPDIMLMLLVGLVCLVGLKRQTHLERFMRG